MFVCPPELQHEGVPGADEHHEEVREHPLPEGGAVDGEVGGHEGRGERHLAVGGGGGPLEGSIIHK